MRCITCGDDFVPTIGQRHFLCLACKRDYNTKWREKRRALGLRAGGTKTWNPEKKEAWRKRYYSNPAVRARCAARMRQYARDPALRIKHEARWQVNRMKVSGHIVNLPCAECGAEHTEGHHPDYNRPLYVVWLCRDCHRALHVPAEGK
jgi:hypothetical protein